MSAVDGVVRQLVAQRLDEPILAMAQFRVAGPKLGFWTPGAVAAFRILDWFARRRHARLPIPAYLAVTDSAALIFSAPFGRTARVVGPVKTWPRLQLHAVRVEGFPFRLKLRTDPRSWELQLDAVEPGPEAGEVIRLLCTK